MANRDKNCGDTDEVIYNNALRFYEYYNEQVDSLINGVIANQITYREPTESHKKTMARTFDKHIMHITYTKQSIHEALEFLISLSRYQYSQIHDSIYTKTLDRSNNSDENNTDIDVREDIFGLFAIRRINLVLSQMAGHSYIMHSLDALSIEMCEIPENLVVSILKMIDIKNMRIMVQTLESCVILVHQGMSQLLSNMSVHKTADGRVVNGVEYPARIFVVYNWVTNWVYNKYRCLQFWMKPNIYDISCSLVGFKTNNDEIGLYKNIRSTIVETMEYFFKPNTLHISLHNMPYLTYYSQWRFSRKLIDQLHNLLAKLVNNPVSMHRANEIISRYKVIYTGDSIIGYSNASNSITISRSISDNSHINGPNSSICKNECDASNVGNDINIGSMESHTRQRQNSLPSNIGASSGFSSSTTSSIGVDRTSLVSSVDSMVVKVPHKKTLIIIDGMNMFYRPDSPATHNINIKLLQDFLNDKGQNTLYRLMGHYINERFNVVINDHEYSQFHVVLVFHERHKKVLDSCMKVDASFGKKGAPIRDNLSYVYTPDRINDDIVALYMWLSNPGSILLTNDEHRNYLPNIPINNTYYRTLWAEWRRLFCISGRDYFSMAYSS